MTTYHFSVSTADAEEAAVLVNRSGSEFAGTTGVGVDGTVYHFYFPNGMVHPGHVAEQEREVHEAIRATIADGPRTHELHR